MKLPPINPRAVLEVIDDELRRAALVCEIGNGPALKHRSPLPEPINLNDLPSRHLEEDTPPFRFRDTYHLNAFLAYHDETFITNAYRGILKRHPDPVGRDHYLNALRSGRLTKIEILGRLRFSPEGRSKRVRIKGLLLPLIVQSSYRVPVVGYLNRMFFGLVHLPAIITNWQRFEAYAHGRFHLIEKSRHDESRLLADRINDLIDTQSLLLRQVERLQARIDELEEMIGGNEQVDDPRLVPDDQETQAP